MALASVAAPIGQSAAPPVPLMLLTSEGRRPLPTTIVGGQEMIALDDVASVLGVTVREDALAGAVTVTYGGQTIVLTPDQTLASVSGRLVSLPAPLTRSGRQWLVPVEFINRALGLIYDSPLELRKDARLAIAGRLRVPRIVARYEPSTTGLRVVFEIAPPTPVAVAQERDRLLVRFEADWLDASLPAVPPSQPFLDGVQLTDPGNTLAIDTGPRFAAFRATTASGDGASSRLTLDLLPSDSETATTAPAAPPPPFPASPAPVPFTAAGAPGLKTIVLDPGHGGDDSGARGARGAIEKDITLAVARRLKTAIETRLGSRVLMTREADRAVTLDERAAMANNNKADLFLSLHANSSVRRSLKGAEVFYLSLDNYGDQVRRLSEAQSQTLPVFGGGDRDIDLISWDMAQARHIDQSARLAGLVEQQLRGRVEMGPRAIEQAPFRVLSGANMPAVVVEMGFVSNAEQERQLTSEAFQTALAQSLFDAVMAYRDSLNVVQPDPPREADAR